MQNFTMQHARPFAKKIMVLLVVCMLASCSFVRMGYHYGETLLYWRLDGYVDFNADQKPWVQQRLAHLFTWHRKTQLPDYVNLLAQIQQQLQRQHPASSAEVLVVADALKKRAVAIFDKALPDLAELALSLHPSQIEHIERTFAARNEDYREDFLRGDREQRQQFRYKKVMEQAEYWFGNFSPEQEALIRQASYARPMNNELRMGVRLQLQQKLISLLKKIHAEKPSREVVMSMLKDYSDDIFVHYGGIEHQAFFAASRDDTARLAAYIINLTTEKQKAHAVDKLQNLMDNFNDLAAGNG